jgi:hypothetical protein
LERTKNKNGRRISKLKHLPSTGGLKWENREEGAEICMERRANDAIGPPPGDTHAKDEKKQKTKKEMGEGTGQGLWYSRDADWI